MVIVLVGPGQNILQCALHVDQSSKKKGSLLVYDSMKNL